MFVTSKVRAKITDADPVFKTRYLGSMEVFVPNGTGCTNAPVQKLWDNSGEEKGMRRVTTVINVHGIFMRDSDKKKDEGQLFPIENISFCNAESIANGKIFSWISKEENGPKLICHAVLCSTPEKAKSMALVMSRAFQIAYKEWKTEQNNVERSERMHSLKTKTSDIKLKPKYEVQQQGSPSVQNSNVQRGNISHNGNSIITEAEVNSKCNENDTEISIHEDDDKSIQSSTSSGKGSVNSKYKHSECQTGDIPNSDGSTISGVNQSIEDDIDSRPESRKDISVQADCSESTANIQKLQICENFEENDTTMTHKL